MTNKTVALRFPTASGKPVTGEPITAVEAPQGVEQWSTPTLRNWAYGLKIRRDGMIRRRALPSHVARVEALLHYANWLLSTRND